MYSPTRSPSIPPATDFDAGEVQLPAGVAWLPFGAVDIFIGGEVDLVGIFGIELGGGIVIDLDTPLDSGIYLNATASAGINVGYGVVGGVVVGGDLEGKAGGVDFNVGPASVMAGRGEDGGIMVGGAGPGIGGSAGLGETGTLSIQMVIDFFKWLF